MLQITKIHVKNFRSLKNCSFELKDLQLLIGPNNSGKTNLLRVFEFLRLLNDPSITEPLDLEKIRFRHKREATKKYAHLPLPVEVTVELIDLNEPQIFFYYKIEFFHVLSSNDFRREGNSVFNEFFGSTSTQFSQIEFENIDLNQTENLRIYNIWGLLKRSRTINIKDESAQIKDLIKLENYSSENDYVLCLKSHEIEFSQDRKGVGYLLNSYNQDDYIRSMLFATYELFKQFVIYKPDTFYIKQPITEFGKVDFIEGNCSNITSYLEGVQSSDYELFQKINNELEKCIPDFKGYSFKTFEITENGTKRNVRGLGLKDKYGVTHLASDISEGTLYLLMLFAIISQKNIPSVLMLEEPETGIHPRRISEIMNFILKLREQYPHLSIIITTHHPYLVDHFSDMTDRVWIFDSENGETKIKNLERDVIQPTNQKLKADDIEPIDYSSSLGEHWSLGFLGGVPKHVA